MIIAGSMLLLCVFSDDIGNKIGAGVLALWFLILSKTDLK